MRLVGAVRGWLFCAPLLCERHFRACWPAEFLKCVVHVAQDDDLPELLDATADANDDLTDMLLPSTSTYSIVIIDECVAPLGELALAHSHG